MKLPRIKNATECSGEKGNTPSEGGVYKRWDVDSIDSGAVCGCGTRASLGENFGRGGHFSGGGAEPPKSPISGKS